MNSLEFLLIGTIIIAQFIVFFKTNAKITQFKDIFKGVSFELLNLNIPNSILTETKPEDIFKDMHQLKENHYGEPVSLIYASSTNETINKITLSLNTYLLKNRNTATEFNVFKDTVERNCDTQDESIGILLPVPLYLGLLGTITGIIFGLLYL